MVVILDTAEGQDYNFTTRTAAAEFIGVSRPTLRTWLKNPFFLYKTLIITHTSNEKAKKSNRALLYKKMRQKAINEIELAKKFHIGNVPVNGSRPKEPSIMGGD